MLLSPCLKFHGLSEKHMSRTEIPPLSAGVCMVQRCTSVCIKTGNPSKMLRGMGIESTGKMYNVPVHMTRQMDPTYAFLIGIALNAYV